MFIASKFLGRLTAVSAALLLLAGCGKKAPVTADDAQVFDKAAPELKQMWQIALEASKTNDYVTAEMVLYRLSRPELTPEQRDAINRQLTGLTERLNDAVAKGDPAAKAAVEELHRNPPNRQRR
jgi:predicted small lipoprotein YifL